MLIFLYTFTFIYLYQDDKYDILLWIANVQFRIFVLCFSSIVLNHYSTALHCSNLSLRWEPTQLNPAAAVACYPPGKNRKWQKSLVILIKETAHGTHQFSNIRMWLQGCPLVITPEDVLIPELMCVRSWNRFHGH